MIVQATKRFTSLQVNSARGSSVVSRSPTPMVQCGHEEADTRIAIHIEDSLRNGARTILGTVDTDVMVIIAGVFFKLQAT